MLAKRLWLPLWHLVCQSVAALDRAIMPKRCVFCGVECRRDERFVCEGCDADLPRIEFACTGCARPIPSAAAPGMPCAECQSRPGPFTVAVAPLHFRFPVDAAVRLLKFRRRLFYAPALGELMCRESAALPDDIDAVLPVPLHWLRHGIRGFNQAEELARPIAGSLAVPVLSNVVRVRSTPYQSGLTARERQRNLRAAFAVRAPIEASHVLIVDDVITTGETCRELANLLREHGVDKVSVLALARA